MNIMGVDVSELQRLLFDYGYNIPADNIVSLLQMYRDCYDEYANRSINWAFDWIIGINEKFYDNFR